MKRKRPFRCRLGFHDWVALAFSFGGGTLEECDRCGCGRLVLLPGSVHINYEPEDMAHINSTRRYYEELEERG